MTWRMWAAAVAAGFALGGTAAAGEDTVRLGRFQPSAGGFAGAVKSATATAESKAGDTELTRGYHGGFGGYHGGYGYRGFYGGGYRSFYGGFPRYYGGYGYRGFYGGYPRYYGGYGYRSFYGWPYYGYRGFYGYPYLGFGGLGYGLGWGYGGFGTGFGYGLGYGAGYGLVSSLLLGGLGYGGWGYGGYYRGYGYGGYYPSYYSSYSTVSYPVAYSTSYAYPATYSYPSGSNTTIIIVPVSGAQAAPSSAPSQIPPATPSGTTVTTPGAAIYQYDGGPANPVPTPAADQPGPTTIAPAASLAISRPAKKPAKKYLAYGEKK